MANTETHRTIDAVWRIESPRVIAALARIVKDVGLAEELAHDALVAALEQWPTAGTPDNPAAWLMSAAKRKALDLLRRNKTFARKHQHLAREFEAQQNQTPDLAAVVDNQFWSQSDDMLRLIFTACHPILPTESRVALTLRLLGGLTTDEIARAFLTQEPTIAQRIVRAKKTLAEKQVPIEVPREEELPERLNSVLEVIYLIFNEGYAATAGDDWMRPALCEDAMRLGRMLAQLAPNESEVHGIVALMEIQASRTRARTIPTGEVILLLDQNRALWDHLLIQRGLAALDRAQELASQTGFGPYTLQAAIAACHARALTADQTDWHRITALYNALQILTPSPIVELNRAVAISMAQGPAVALPLVEALFKEPTLKNYHLLPSVRADLLFKLNRLEEAKKDFETAAALAKNEREKQLLLKRAKECDISSPA